MSGRCRACSVSCALFAPSHWPKVLATEPGTMTQAIPRAIPGQACSSHAGAHVVEDGADESPC
eukprot:4814540-Pyramimonas_sp.AAC.1